MKSEIGIFLSSIQSGTFVIRDLEMLKKRYKVHYFLYYADGKITKLALLFRWVVQLLELIKTIPQTDVYICWFVDYHAFLPALFAKIRSKKLIVVLGGFDVLNFPEWKHGLFASWWRRPIGKWIYKRTDVLLPVTETLIYSKNSYSDNGVVKEYGLSTQIKLPSARIIPLPTAYNSEEWKTTGSDRGKTVCTVAVIDSERRIIIKGIDIYVAVATLMPEVQFELIGVVPSFGNKLKSLLTIPGNLSLKPPMSTQLLNDRYASNSLYLQCSRVEGLPNVVCEAMLCGCIPIGSNVFGIPEIIGDAGTVIDSAEPEVWADAIRTALKNVSSESRKKARDRIISKFSPEKREQGFRKAIEEK